MENASISVADERKFEITDTSADSLSLGSALLGWLTIVFAFASLNYYPVSGMVLSVVFFCGFGFLIVALTSWKKGNEFGLFAFGMIMVFAWSFVALNILPATGLVSPPTPAEFATFMISFALFVAMLAIITTFFPVRLLTIIIGLASAMFMMVGIHALATDATLLSAIGVLAVIVGVLAFYLSVASVINGCARKQVCPILIKKS
jgi:succinate-acetate transporter protein